MTLQRLSASALTGIAFAGLAAMYAVGFLVHDWLVVRTLVALGWIVTFAVLAWVRLDETAREAHKFAWFYGAGVGLMLMLIAAMFAIWAPGSWDELAARVTTFFGPAVSDMPPALAGLIVGLMACAIAQVIGYGLVWCGWWVRRR